MVLDPLVPAHEGEAVILALNSGSSSFKFGLYRVSRTRTEKLLSGKAESIGKDVGDFHAQDAAGNVLMAENAPLAGYDAAITRIATLLSESKMPSPVAVGHRVVHGGPVLTRHCRVDDTVLRTLEAAAVFAPLHTASALAVIRAAQTQFSGLPQVVCFDTAFHDSLPPIARTLPLPKVLRSQGLRRYGFHGLSCESILHRLGPALPERLIVAHLGNGASITAIEAGQSIDTSMGLTPTGGVIMGTRTGDLDPGTLIYLMREMHFGSVTLEDLIDRQSGLKGISGIDGDMRVLHDRAGANPDARLAVDMFCYSVRKQIAAMIAVLNGIDMIVFTGGIGENDAEVRAAICAGLTCFGIGLDGAANLAANDTISDPGSACAIRILPSEEEAQIARHSWALTEIGPSS